MGIIFTRNERQKGREWRGSSLYSYPPKILGLRIMRYGCLNTDCCTLPMKPWHRARADLNVAYSKESMDLQRSLSVFLARATVPPLPDQETRVQTPVAGKASIGYVLLWLS